MNKIIIVHYEEDQAAVDAFKKQVEHLWYQHVDYTRNAIISILGTLGDAAAVVERLMKNQTEIGMAVAPYYGAGAGEAVATLLKKHITLIEGVVKNIKEAKSTVELEASLQENATDIATFLDSADPDNWPLAVVNDILKKHIECTLAQARSRAATDWAADFAAFDFCKTNIEMLAYAMANGIVDKFPEAFVMQYSSKVIKKK